jgi:hypothetical protein
VYPEDVRPAATAPADSTAKRFGEIYVLYSATALKWLNSAKIMKGSRFLALLSLFHVSPLWSILHHQPSARLSEATACLGRLLPVRPWAACRLRH